MSTYVMSDFHGRHDFFMRMLEKIDFSENDTLYILGDVADRGPDGIKTFMYIMDKPNIVYLVGNHDLFLTDAYKRSLLVSDSESFYATREWMIWYYNGGLTTWSEFVKLDRTERRRIVSYIELRHSGDAGADAVQQLSRQLPAFPYRARSDRL